jgi:hypothetical protein
MKPKFGASHADSAGKIFVTRGFRYDPGCMRSSGRRQPMTHENLSGRLLSGGNAGREFEAPLGESTPRFVLKVRKSPLCSGGDSRDRDNCKPLRACEGDAVVASQVHREGVCDRICLP